MINLESSDTAPLHFIELDQELAILSLVRSAIAQHWQPSLPLPEVDLGSAHRGCFITLHLDGQLRGCIGCIEPEQALPEQLVKFAKSAAFKDPRFAPLTESELPKVNIGVSLLSELHPVEASSKQSLLNQLRPNIDGVLIKEGRHRSTFLPSVWRTLPDKEAFISALLKKGGWQGPQWPHNMQAWRYQTHSFEE